MGTAYCLRQEDLLEIIMGVGRPSQARFLGQVIHLATDPVSPTELEQAIASVGEFSADNRASIEGTLPHFLLA